MRVVDSRLKFLGWNILELLATLAKGDRDPLLLRESVCVTYIVHHILVPWIFLDEFREPLARCGVLVFFTIVHDGG